MKKVSLVVYDFYKNNRLFDLTDTICNRDNCQYHWYILKQKFAEVGYDLSTYDINKPEDSDIVLYCDILQGNFFFKNIDKHKNFLIIFEPPFIMRDSWDKNYHKYFNKIFTWYDDIIDNKLYIKYFWPNKIQKKLKNFNTKNKKSFCTLIAGNKYIKHPDELYSERVKAIRWFEKNNPEQFDLYGIGWNKYIFKNKFLNKINRFNKLCKLIPFGKYPSYKGMIDSKYEVLKQYKFAICYENLKNMSGWITEKIFDCFFSGCISVYWGAPNITDFVPENTFVDFRRFCNYEKLYNYLINMSETEYNNYLEAIKKYVKSDKIDIFSSEQFALTLFENILN